MKNFPTTQAFILLLPKVCKEEMNTRCYICPAGAQLSWNLFLSICPGFLLYVTHKVTRLRTIYIFLMVENASRDHLEWKVSGIYEPMQTRTVNSTITGKQNNFASGNSEWVFNTSQQYSSFPRAHQRSSNLLLFLGFWWGRFPKTPKIIFFSLLRNHLCDGCSLHLVKTPVLHCQVLPCLPWRYTDANIWAFLWYPGLPEPCFYDPLWALHFSTSCIIDAPCASKANSKVPVRSKNLCCVRSHFQTSPILDILLKSGW